MKPFLPCSVWNSPWLNMILEKVRTHLERKRKNRKVTPADISYLIMDYAKAMPYPGPIRKEEWKSPLHTNDCIPFTGRMNGRTLQGKAVVERM